MKSKLIISIIGILGLSLLILYFTGYFSEDRIKPGLVQRKIISSFQPMDTARVQIKSINEIYVAVGTIRPRTETKIEAQVTGKILEVLIKPGDVLKKGAKMIVLEDKSFQARLERARQGLRFIQAKREQAKQMIEAAQAFYSKAESQYKRVQQLFHDKVLSSRELEQAEAEFLQSEAELRQAKDGLKGAEAGVKQAQELVEEAKIALEYTVIKAMEDVEIAKRLVEPGDLAIPGKPLLIVQGAGSMRLEAFVREGLISQIHPGKELSVAITVLEKTVMGVVEEVVPSADPKTRTFLVKVGLPNIFGIYPGMFGRLLVPSGLRKAILVPGKAVRRVGQLETVMVLEDNVWKKIYVKTGKKVDNQIEILSGLKGNETIALFGS